MVDFESHTRLTGDGIFCRSTDILRPNPQTAYLDKALASSETSITLDAQECNHAAAMDDSEVRMWDANRRRQVGADKQLTYLKEVNT